MYSSSNNNRGGYNNGGRGKSGWGRGNRQGGQAPARKCHTCGKYHRGKCLMNEVCDRCGQKGHTIFLPTPCTRPFANRIKSDAEKTKEADDFAVRQADWNRIKEEMHKKAMEGLEKKKAAVEHEVEVRLAGDTSSTPFFDDPFAPENMALP